MALPLSSERRVSADRSRGERVEADHVRSRLGAAVRKVEMPPRPAAAAGVSRLDRWLAGRVLQAIGDPGGTSVNSEGLESWRYSDSAKAFIPFYTVSGGKFQHLTVNFDKDGKVKDWSSSTQGAF